MRISFQFFFQNYKFLAVIATHVKFRLPNFWLLIKIFLCKKSMKYLESDLARTKSRAMDQPSDSLPRYPQCQIDLL